MTSGCGCIMSPSGGAKGEQSGLEGGGPASDAQTWPVCSDARRCRMCARVRILCPCGCTATARPVALDGHRYLDLRLQFQGKQQLGCPPSPTPDL